MGGSIQITRIKAFLSKRFKHILQSKNISHYVSVVTVQFFSPKSAAIENELLTLLITVSVTMTTFSPQTFFLIETISPSSSPLRLAQLHNSKPETQRVPPNKDTLITQRKENFKHAFSKL